MTGGAGNGKRYFSHDSDAFFDSRIVKMRTRLGVAGYGAYWMIVERLRTSEGYKHECDYEVFACLANADAELFRAVVEDHGLFEFVENDGKRYFYSESLMRRMMKMEDIIEKRREAGRRGAEARWQTDDNADPLPEQENDTNVASAIANAKQVLSDCHSTALAKNGKLNKTKLKQNNSLSPESEGSTEKPSNSEVKTQYVDTLMEKRSDDRSPPEIKPFIELPLNDGSFHKVTFEDVERYRELYQAVNVEQELRAMVGWLDANPTRRKTSRGVKSFITGWLKRSQDRGVMGGAGRVYNNVKDNRGNFKEGEERATGADAGYDTRMPRLTDDKENVESAMREPFG